eukprot:GEMP01040955.1.p1 GENE.GEMP01040955.1~~GEMP01040955.1.p1  ORF type:complete len:413 (+),score=101.21 GEMP01040955.1:259-1497(+)
MAFNGDSNDDGSAIPPLAERNWADVYSPTMNPIYFRSVNPPAPSRHLALTPNQRWRNAWTPSSSAHGRIIDDARLHPFTPVRMDFASGSVGIHRTSQSSSGQKSYATSMAGGLEPIVFSRCSQGSFFPASPSFVYDSTPSLLFHPIRTSHRSFLSSKQGTGSPGEVGLNFMSPRTGSRVLNDPMVIVPSRNLEEVERGQMPAGHIPARTACLSAASTRTNETPEQARTQLSANTAEQTRTQESVNTAEDGSKQESPKTTLMLRGLPNKYTREMVLEEIAKRGLMKDINFFYLPIDLRQKCNVGYCFLNVVSEAAAERFRTAFEGTKMEQVKSTKKCAVSEGKVQGLAANIEAYRNSAVMSMSVEFHPLIFINGEPEPFPAPTLTREQTRKLKPEKKGVSSHRRRRKEDARAQ